MPAHVRPELRRLHHHERDVAVVGRRVHADQRVDRRARARPAGAPSAGSRCLVSATVWPIDHSPLPSSETSTTDGSPVRSRFSSAAAIPPARLVPGDGVAVGRSGRADHAVDPRRRDSGRGACAAPEGGHVVAALDRFLAARSQRTAPGVDDLRVHRADVVDVDAELLPMPGRKLVRNTSARFGQLQQYLAPLGHRHVQPDAALAAVGVLDVGVGVALDAQRARSGAGRAVGHR